MITTAKTAVLLVAAISTMAIAGIISTQSTYATTGAAIADPMCVDGTDQTQLVVDFMKEDSTLNIWTRSGQPLCNDVTLYYSNYSMPNSYDGNGFYTDPSTGTLNPTAVPQTLQQSTQFTFKAGTSRMDGIAVPTPDHCYITQADVYYGTEVTSIGTDGYGRHDDGTPVPTDGTKPLGHGTQYVASTIFDDQDTSVCPVQTPGRGEGTGTTTDSTTPTTPTAAAPATTTAVLPEVLPNTGIENFGQNVLSTLATAIFAAASCLTIGMKQLRR